MAQENEKILVKWILEFKPFYTDCSGRRLNWHFHGQIENGIIDTSELFQHYCCMNDICFAQRKYNILQDQRMWD